MSYQEAILKHAPEHWDPMYSAPSKLFQLLPSSEEYRKTSNEVFKVVQSQTKGIAKIVRVQNVHDLGQLLIREQLLLVANSPTDYYRVKVKLMAVLAMEEIIDLVDQIISDDEDNMDAINIVEAPRRLREFKNRPNHLEDWDDEQFIHRFRLSKMTVEMLFWQIEERLQRPTNQNHALSPLTQLLIALRYYAMGSMLIVAGDFGGIHKSTTSTVIRQVSRVIASLAPHYLKMPQNEKDLRKAKQDFLQIARFPNLIGAIDCTHVRISSPGGENAEYFRNRKGYFSLNVQTVSDANLKIRNVVARWPGACHDMTIFSNSRLKAEFEENRYGDGILVGDSGYALAEYMMTPLENPQTRAEQLYNESQIRSRNVVERQYGVWKRRFPILRNTLSLKIQTSQAVIVATAVLHNIAIDNNDELPEEIEEVADDNDIEYNRYNPVGNGQRMRRELIDNYFALLL